MQNKTKQINGINSGTNATGMTAIESASAIASASTASAFTDFIKTYF